MKRWRGWNAAWSRSRRSAPTRCSSAKWWPSRAHRPRICRCFIAVAITASSRRFDILQACGRRRHAPYSPRIEAQQMIRTGEQYRDSIRDGRQVWINGERVKDVTTHPMFKPIVDIRARIHDMAHEAQHAPMITYIAEPGETNAVSTKLPLTLED